MKRNRKATHIQWDVDELEDLELLPTEIDIPDDMTDMEEISDYITDQTGFCHNGFISEVFTFSVIYRYMELEKPLTGAFTIEGLTKKMDALRKAHHLL